MTLNDILHSAQRARAVANLRLGLAPAAAQAAAKAMILRFRRDCRECPAPGGGA